MAKHYRLRLQGKQRDDIDTDLFTEALLLVIQELEQSDDMPVEEDEDYIEDDCS